MDAYRNGWLADLKMLLRLKSLSRHTEWLDQFTAACGSCFSGAGCGAGLAGGAGVSGAGCGVSYAALAVLRLVDLHR